MALLEARNLRKTYRLGKTAGVQALRGVDVTIEAGEMVAIMGPSGSGKTTLMHILGLLHQPDLDGTPRPSLVIGGRDMTKLSDGARTRTRAEHLGFVFQSYNLVPTLSAAENVALAAEYAGHGGSKGRPKRWRLSISSAWPTARDTVPASSPAASSSASRSRGRWSIGPQLVLGDEPTGNLDSARTADVLALLRRFNRERGQTFVIVTHDPEVGAAARPDHPNAGRARPRRPARAGCVSAGTRRTRRKDTTMTATDLFPRDTAGLPFVERPDPASAPRRRSTGPRDRARRQEHRRVHRPDDRLQRLDPRPDPPRRPRVRDHRRRHEQRRRRDDRPLARPPARQPLRRRPGRHAGTDRDRRRLLVPHEVPGPRLLLVPPPSPRGLRPGDGDVRDDHRRARGRRATGRASIGSCRSRSTTS